MATVAVSVKDFTSGTLPRVCVKTGATAVANPDITANRDIGWTWVLLLFGILPFFIARAFSSHRVKGYVQQSWLTWFGVVLFGLSVLTTIFGTWFVWPSAVLDDEGSVLLSFVHPDFAGAVLARGAASPQSAGV